MGIKVHQQSAFASAGGEPFEAVLDAGDVIAGKYRVEGCLGVGGMGVVYRVRHLGLERSFALKLIRFPHLPAAGGRSFAERFRIEARALGRLRHPHIVEVTDYGVDPRDGGLPYLVMELLEGATLKDLCAGALAVERALPLLEAIAEAVDHAHDRGVLHRDLKPANVFLSSGTLEGAEVKVLDFGLAGLDGFGTEEPLPNAKSEGTEAGAFPGTPAYLAPEVVSGEEATRAADVYSFGVLAYEILAGRPPFTGAPAEIRRAQVEAPPPRPSQLNPTLPRELDPVLLAPLAKDPERRPRRAAGVVEALRSAAVRAERRRWRARQIPRRLLLSGSAAPLIVLLAVFLGRWGPVEKLERRSVDARFAAQPARSPDPRILVVSIDEPSLAADATPLADRGEEIGRALEEVFAAGAKGVAIDFLLPEAWSRSEAFSRLVLKHAGSLTLAAFSSSTGETVGTECVRGLTAVVLGPARLSELFGFVNLDEDADGVIRRARLAFPDREGKLRPAWAARAARSLENLRAPQEVWIDSAVDWRRLERISYRDLPGRLAQDPGLARGRLVLLGGDFLASGDDDHRIPRRAGSPPAVSGVVLQALLVDAILAGLPVRQGSGLPCLLMAGLACMILLAAVLCLPRLGLAASLFFGLNGLYVLAAFAVFRELRILLPITVPLLALALSLGAGLAMRRALGVRPR